MKTSFRQRVGIISALAVFGITFIALNEKSSPAQTQASPLKSPGGQTTNIFIPQQIQEFVKVQTPASPFIVRDTLSDSPGTNIVTRIVTIAAEVDGTQPIALQWKVDKGNGFAKIPGATNASLRIGNAQVADSGLYSLFATNSAGHTNTTPVPLIVIEGED